MVDYYEKIISEPFLSEFIIILLGIILILTVIGFIKKTLHKYVKDHNDWYKTRKAVNFLGYLFVVIFILMTYSDGLGGFTVFLGIAGAGIAFALQEVIVSLAGWMTIVFSDIYKTGDRVSLGGVKGDVIDVGILRTTIMEIGQWVDGDLYNGRIVRITNSFVFKEPVYNYSADFPFLWDEIKIPIKYGSDYNLARKIINDVAQEIVGDYANEAEEHWRIMLRKFLVENASTQPRVTIKANDNWVEYTLRFVVDYKKRVSTKDVLFTRILEELEKNSDKVGLASATFQIVGTSPFEETAKKDS